jgi:dihydropteroate synthase
MLTHYRGARIMGIVNITPDSFSDAGQFASTAKAVAHARFMAEAGAALIDIGGESTRPGAEPVDAGTEIKRVLPVIRALADWGKEGPLLSIDTAKAEVAEAALQAGAHVVNDVTALGDPDMAAVVGRHRAGLVLMHMQGTPRTMQENPRYCDVVREVGDFLAARIAVAAKAGIPAARIVVDPGIGFGKTIDHNLALLRGLPALRARTGRPLLVGASRKRFIGELTGRLDPAERLGGSLAVLAWAVLHGVEVIRVHDAKESCDAARMLATLLVDEGDE